MRLLLFIVLICLGFNASAQWTIINGKQRFAGGLGIPTRDTVTGLFNDSSQIVLRPQDSTLWFKYKRAWRKIDGSGGSTPTLQQVTTQGNSTTDSINIIDGSGNRLISLNKRSSGPPTDLGGLIRIKNNFNSFYSDYYATGIFFLKTNSNNIGYPDSSGTLPLRIKLNSAFFNAANNGTIDLGTITASADSSIFATRFWVNSNFQPIGNYITTGSNASLQSLTITGTNGNGHIHLRHQASLPTATGQSSVIYANSQGNFAWKNDGNYHTTLKTDANTADRTYTFQNKDYTLADNAEVVKYTDTSSMLSPYLRKIDTASLSNRINLKLNISDTSAMLDGRISSITLNTSGAIHTNPITFSRVGGAWSGTMSLSNQNPFTVFNRGTGTGTPSFSAIDSNYFGGNFRTQTRATFSYREQLEQQPANVKARRKYSYSTEFGPIVVPGSASSGAVNVFHWNHFYSFFNAANTQFTVVSASTYEDALQLSTGTVATGNASAITTSANSSVALTLNADTVTQEWRVQIPTLNDGTDRFYFFVGFANNQTTTAQADAIAFVYDFSGSMTGSASSANWQVMTAASSNRSWTTTGVAVTAGQWYKLTTKSITGRVEFYIDDVLVRTETNNVPSVGIRQCISVVKTNGTNARTALADYNTLERFYSTVK